MLRFKHLPLISRLNPPLLIHKQRFFLSLCRFGFSIPREGYGNRFIQIPSFSPVTKFNKQSAIVGVLLGSSFKGTVDVTNSYASLIVHDKICDMTVEFLCLYVESKFYKEMEFASNAKKTLALFPWFNGLFFF
ncbi:hypothetical protein Hanom_Chr10g00930821 [Helianthus anomalus]